MSDLLSKPITVTERHISEGERKNHRRCAVALAIKEIVPDVSVAAGRGWVTVGNTDYETPLEVVGFMCDFDDGREVAPFTFQFTDMFDSVVF